jgi:hypothetical protein
MPKNPQGREARLAPKDMAVASSESLRINGSYDLEKRGDCPNRLSLKQTCLSLAFVASGNRGLLRHCLRLVSVRFGLYRDVVTLKLAIESRATNAQHFPCESFVAVGLFEHAENRNALHFR